MKTLPSLLIECSNQLRNSFAEGKIKIESLIKTIKHLQGKEGYFSPAPTSLAREPLNRLS